MSYYMWRNIRNGFVRGDIKMVFPIAAAAIIAAAGVGGTLLGGAFGGGKKEVHATKEHYAPVITDARATAQTFAPTYQYQIDSPKAIMTSKKDLDTAASSEPDVTSERSADTPSPMDLTTIAVVGVIGLVAYGIVTKK